MDPRKQRLEQKSENAIVPDFAQTSRQSTRQSFESPEELLRADRHQTQVPAALAERLNQNVAPIPVPRALPWWKRLFA
jgi:hypothetical protein